MAFNLADYTLNIGRDTEVRARKAIRPDWKENLKGTIDESALPE